MGFGYTFSMHDHHHSHHDHGQTPRDFTRAFQVGVLLNLVFVVIEFTYGFISNSMALVADAGHNLSDVLGLLLAWGAMVLSKRRPTNRFSYGLKSTSIWAALLNGILILLALGAVILESIQRFKNPETINPHLVISVAAIGVIVNGVTAYLFHAGKDHDLNLKGAFLHMLGDALISVGVVISGIIYIYQPVPWLDSVLGLFISGIILWSTLKMLRQVLGLSLHAVPDDIHLDEIRKVLLNDSDILSVHDLHVWAISTTESALTCHIVAKNIQSFIDSTRLSEITEMLKHDFEISHVTIQVEKAASHLGCEQDCY